MEEGKVDGTVETVVEGNEAQVTDQTTQQGTEQQVEVPEAPQFDPSKVDLSNPDDLTKLSDEEIAKLEEFNKTGAAPPTKVETAEEVAAREAATAAAAPVVYAGKYKTSDELAKGVTNLVEKLGLPKEAFDSLLEIAKSKNDFKGVETVYKQLETLLSSKVPDKGKEGQPGAAPDKGTAAAETFNPTDPQTVSAVESVTMQQIASSSLAAEMSAKGLKLPQNMEEFNALTEISPYYAMEFKMLYRESFTKNLEQAKGYFDSAKQVEPSNAKVVDTDTQAIKVLAESYGIKITDEELATVKAEALANPYNFEVKYGHKFLRPNAVKDQYIINKLPGKIEEIKLAQQAVGRTQAVADLEKAGKKEVRSIGTSSLSTKTRAIPKMPDLTDPEVLRNLPDAALEDPEGYFRHFLKK